MSDEHEEFERQVRAQMERIGDLLNQGGVDRDGPTTMAMLNHVVEALVSSGMPRDLFIATCSGMFDWYSENMVAPD
ncbi:MAG: hypothetical protein ABW252_11150 [Polyangiales bacterium]